MRVYYVYILASRSRVLYTGVTNDLVRRVSEHRLGRSAGFTSRYRITRLVYFEEFTHIRNAIAREKEIKDLADVIPSAAGARDLLFTIGTRGHNRRRKQFGPCTNPQLALIETPVTASRESVH